MQNKTSDHFDIIATRVQRCFKPINNYKSSKTLTMKRIVLLLILHFFVTIVSAQHLKFEGIPIDGTITNFQQKLQTKGMNVNRTKSNDAPVGQRIFNGKFRGYNAEITVYYGRKTKIVYKVEAVIESKKKEFIQTILDKSLEKIENTYHYRSEHDVEDATDMHFRYHIYQTKTSEQSIGMIEIHPSHSYYLTGNGDAPLEFANFIIQFTYEDRANTDSTSPSELAPKSNPNFTCGEPENFGKFAKWMLKYTQNGCYEKAIYYLFWLLDYYKYDCVPSNVRNSEISENQIDELIKALREKRVGSIPTGVGMEMSNVYRIVDNETGLFKFIEFDASYYHRLLHNHIKLGSYDIILLKKSLEELKQEFEKKKEFAKKQPIDEHKTESISTYLPAYVGTNNTKNGDHGDIDWKYTKLKAYFSYWDGLSLNITVEDEFQFVFRFKEIGQIDNLISFLDSVQL